MSAKSLESSPVPVPHAYRVHGLHCIHEVRALEAALRGQPGVLDLHVDLVAEKLTISRDPACSAPADVEQLVAAAGMAAVPWEAVSEATVVRRKPIAGICATASGVLLVAGLLVEALGSGTILAILTEVEGPHRFSALARSLFVLSGLSGLGPTIPAAWRSLRMRRLDMNVLVLISMTGAALLGEWSEAAALACLFTIAGVLESWSASHARSAVADLIWLTPPHAHVLEHGVERCVPVTAVQPGTRVLVRPGERVPVDGLILSGRSAIDQSALTGETVPALVGPGDHVPAGALNGQGALEVRAECLHADSAAARLVRAIENARSSRAHVELWIEQFSYRYTPVVLVLALLVAVLPPLAGVGPWSDWFHRALVVTLVACPCALVISTPVTMAAAITAAARRGVLIKAGETLERLARSAVVALDKTGVITQGEPEVESFAALGDHREDEVLRWMAAIEARSEHPLGRAVVKFVASRGLTLAGATDVLASPGCGVEGTVDGRRYWIGNHRRVGASLLRDERLNSHVEVLERRGLTVVFCGADDGVWAVLGIRDPLRPGVVEAISALRQMGRRCILLTGDRSAAAHGLARQLYIDDVRAGLLPADKQACVLALEQEYGGVVMVGDGINDTPALLAASVGVALGPHCADTAMEAASVRCVRPDLAAIPWAIAHARRALGVVKQNVAFAIGLKLFFLLMALSGHATLWIAVAADTGATLAVTLNGLRLLRGRAASPVERRCRPHATDGERPTVGSAHYASGGASAAN